MKAGFKKGAHFYTAYFKLMNASKGSFEMWLLRKLEKTFGPIVREMTHCKESRRRGISYKQLMKKD
jgi:hypothetical protein